MGFPIYAERCEWMPVRKLKEYLFWIYAEAAYWVKLVIENSVKVTDQGSKIV